MRTLLFGLIVLTLLPLPPSLSWAKSDTTAHLSAAPLSLYAEDKWPPYSYEEDKISKGLNVDLVKEMQSLMKDNTPIQALPWPRAFLLAQQKPNVVLFTLVRNPEREKMFTLLGPLGPCEIALYGLESRHLNLKSLEDAKKLRAIAATEESVFSSTLEDEGLTNILYTKGPSQEALLLKAGRVDLIAGDSHVIQQGFQQAGLENVSLKKYYSLGKRDIYIAFSKGTPRETIERWKNALIQLKSNGRFQEISKQWLQGGEISPKVELIGYLPPHSSK